MNTVWTRVALVGLIIVAAMSSAMAQAPVLARKNLFRDFRGQNDVNLTSGDRLQLGANVQGGSLNTSIQGIFEAADPSKSFVTSTLPCAPLTDNANFCAIAPPFSPARMQGVWKAKFTNASGSTTITMPDPSVIPLDIVPFPVNVNIVTDNSGNPTISWTIPDGANINYVRVTVFDKSQLRVNGTAQQIEYANIDPSVTSYTPTSALAVGGNYALNIQLVRTRDGGPVVDNTGNSNFLSRSSAFYSFTKPDTASAPPAQLPQVSANEVFSFNVTDVSPDEECAIDPPVAVGYDYATGPNDPNFKSVKLPVIGSSSYTVSYTSQNTTLPTVVAVAPNQQFFFPEGGVSKFSVRGIETIAALSPSNGGAFVTGLTFSARGSFTGTMTPFTIGNNVFASVLPSSRSVSVGQTATAFATIINNGDADVSGCSIAPAGTIAASFSYQTYDKVAGALTGSPNTPVTIPAKGHQDFVIGLTPTDPIAPTDVAFAFVCSSTAESVPTILGVNSLQFSAEANPVPDIVALAATASGDGYVNVDPSTTTGAFAVAAVNVGNTADITVSADTGGSTLPLTLSLCETNPDGSCKATPSAAVTTSIASLTTPTFSIFAIQSAPITPDPATKRIFVRFKDANGVVRGSTSVAVQTHAAPDSVQIVRAD